MHLLPNVFGLGKAWSDLESVSMMKLENSLLCLFFFSHPTKLLLLFIRNLFYYEKISVVTILHIPTLSFLLLGPLLLVIRQTEIMYVTFFPSHFSLFYLYFILKNFLILIFFLIVKTHTTWFVKWNPVTNCTTIILISYVRKSLGPIPDHE